jgi:hypothetical protein
MDCIRVRDLTDFTMSLHTDAKYCISFMTHPTQNTENLDFTQKKVDECLQANVVNAHAMVPILSPLETHVGV